MHAAIAVALLLWRVLRMRTDGYGPAGDWLFVLGCLWLGISLVPKKRADDALFGAACIYLFVLYGYFQLGASVQLFSAWLGGW